MRTPSLITALLATSIGSAAAQPPMVQSPPAVTYTQPLGPQAIQLVQQQLQKQGAYTGRIDGVWGTDSQKALEHFQQMHGLQVSGQLNQATAATLGIPPDQLVSTAQPVPSATAATIAGSSLSRGVIQAIQGRMRDLNYYHGAVDGIWGDGTQQAIERFQQGRGLQANGQLNPATLAALRLDPNMLAPPSR
jgi:peptidoglycan hydrolase-like protein with peptidoglycan-binding domain